MREAEALLQNADQTCLLRWTQQFQRVGQVERGPAVEDHVQPTGVLRGCEDQQLLGIGRKAAYPMKEGAFQTFGQRQGIWERDGPLELSRVEGARQLLQRQRIAARDVKELRTDLPRHLHA